MINARLARVYAVSFVLSASWPGQGLAQENNASVTKGVVEFQTVFRTLGMPGAIARIAECWRDVEQSLSQDRIAFCFTVDFSASDFSEYLAKQQGGSQPDELLRIERVLARVNVALKRMKVEQSDRGKLIAGWIRLSRMALAAGENPNGVSSRSEDQPIFEQAKRAILTKIQNPGAAKFANIQKLNVVDFKGVMTTVVCGTVDFKRRQDSNFGSRRFVYFVKDKTAYVDTGSADALDLGSEIIKNFCS